MFPTELARMDSAEAGSLLHLRLIIRFRYWSGGVRYNGHVPFSPDRMAGICVHRIDGRRQVVILIIALPGDDCLSRHHAANRDTSASDSSGQRRLRRNFRARTSRPTRGMQARVLIFGSRLGDFYRARRTLRSLVAAASKGGPRDAWHRSLRARGRAGALLGARAPGWSVRKGLGFPPAKRYDAWLVSRGAR